MSGALFLVLDGIDGCGKSTQATRLCDQLERAGRPRPLHLREPGSTGLGEALRGHLLDSDWELSPSVEVLLFASARRQLLDECVAPSLAAGRDVICERFHASTYAYQGHAGLLDAEELMGLLTGWANTPPPDAEWILTLSVATAHARRGEDRDRIERRGVEYQERVAEGYEAYVQRVPHASSVNAERDPDAVAADLWERTRALLDA